MYGSTSESPGEPTELRRITEDLFHALRTEFDVDATVIVDLSKPDAVDAHGERRSTAVLCLVCTQMIHHLGRPRSLDDNADDVFALAHTLEALLARLLDETAAASRAVDSIRRIRRQLNDFVLALPPH